MVYMYMLWNPSILVRQPRLGQLQESVQLNRELLISWVHVLIDVFHYS